MSSEQSCVECRTVCRQASHRLYPMLEDSEMTQQGHLDVHTAMGIPVAQVNVAYAMFCVISVDHRGERCPFRF